MNKGGRYETKDKGPDAGTENGDPGAQKFFYSVCDPSRTCDPCDDSSDIQSKL